MILFDQFVVKLDAHELYRFDEVTDFVNIPEKRGDGLHRLDGNLPEHCFRSMLHVPFSGEMMLADIVSQQAEHEDHKRALHWHAVYDLSARFEDAMYFFERLLEFVRFKVFKDTDQKDSIELTVLIRHFQHIPITEIREKTMRGKNPFYDIHVAGQVEPMNLFIHVVQVKKSQTTAESDLKDAVPAFALLDAQLHAAAIHRTEDGQVIENHRVDFLDAFVFLVWQ